MRTETRLLLTDARTLLEERVASFSTANIHDAAFLAWMLPSHSPRELKTVGREAAKKASLSGRSFKDLAAMGFALSGTAGDTLLNSAFESGISWLVGTTPSPGAGLPGPAGDSIALLGLTIGLRSLGNDELKGRFAEWLSPQLRKSGPHYSAWDSIVVRSAAESLGLTYPPEHEKGFEGADVRLTLAIHNSTEIQAGDAEAVVRLAMHSHRDIEPLHAAVRLAALNHVMTIACAVDFNTPMIDDVVRLLEAIPRALQEWTWEPAARTKNGQARQWHVDHEYHVQNLLWMVLAPIFPDLQREEYLEKLGVKQPRADILLPSLRLIIEVKHARTKEALRGLIDEIAADASLYFASKQNYDQMIVFVWDETRQTELSHQVRIGIEALRNVIRAIIVSKPGKMG